MAVIVNKSNQRNDNMEHMYNTTRTILMEGVPDNTTRTTKMEGVLDNTTRTTITGDDMTTRTTIMEGDNTTRTTIMEGDNTTQTTIMEGDNTTRTTIMEGDNTTQTTIMEGDNTTQTTIMGDVLDNTTQTTIMGDDNTTWTTIMKDVLDNTHLAMKHVWSYLRSHLLFANTHGAEFISGSHWETFVPEVCRDQLLSMTREELVNLSQYQRLDSSKTNLNLTSSRPDLEAGDWLSSFTAGARECHLDNIAAVSTLSDVVKACCNNGLTCVQGSAEILSEVAMSEKKNHEIRAMSEAVMTVFRCSRADVVVDVGSGKGYLGWELAHHHDLPVLGLDSCHTNTHGAVRREGMLARQWKSLAGRKERKNRSSEGVADCVPGCAKTSRERQDCVPGCAKTSRERQDCVPGCPKASRERQDCVPGCAKTSRERQDCVPGCPKASRERQDCVPGCPKASRERQDCVPGCPKASRERQDCVNMQNCVHSPSVSTESLPESEVGHSDELCQRCSSGDDGRQTSASSDGGMGAACDLPGGQVLGIDSGPGGQVLGIESGPGRQVLGIDSGPGETVLGIDSGPGGQVLGIDSGPGGQVLGIDSGPGCQVLGIDSGPGGQVLGIDSGPGGQVLGIDSGPGGQVLGIDSGPGGQVLGIDSGPGGQVLGIDSGPGGQVLGIDSGPGGQVLGIDSGPGGQVLGIDSGPGGQVLGIDSGPGGQVLGIDSGPGGQVLGIDSGPSETVLGIYSGPGETVLAGCGGSCSASTGHAETPLIVAHSGSRREFRLNTPHCPPVSEETLVSASLLEGPTGGQCRGEDQSSPVAGLSVHSYVPVTMTVAPRMDLHKTLQEHADRLGLNSPLSSDILITGLHTCGSLSVTLMELFLQSPSVVGLCFVGCCYQLMEESGASGGAVSAAPEANDEVPPEPSLCHFPLSDFGKQLNLTLGRNARNLASQSVARIQATGQLQGADFCWRAMLDVLLRKQSGAAPERIMGMRGLNKRSRSFLEYVQAALAKLKISSDSISASEVASVEETYLDIKHKMSAFFQLKLVLAPVIESLILLDRFTYLLEQDSVGSAHLVRLFDPVTSPRCYGIMAVKGRLVAQV